MWDFEGQEELGNNPWAFPGSRGGTGVKGGGTRWGGKAPARGDGRRGTWLKVLSLCDVTKKEKKGEKGKKSPRQISSEKSGEK